jgi:alpha-glucosidase
VYREFRAILDGYEVSDGRPRAIIGEIHLFDLDRWARYFGTDGKEMHLPFNFGLLKVPWRGDTVGHHVAEIERVTAAVGWPSYVLGNHDEHRPVARLGAGQARVGMVLLLTLRGTPTLYYGDELGHPDVAVLPERERDPWGLRVPGLGLSRDPARTPMPWTTGPSGGFTDPGVEPWLPVVDDLATFSVAAQAADPGSMLRLTRRLVELRRGSAALTVGGYRELAATPAVLAYERRAGEEVVLVALNFSSASAEVTLGAGTAEVLAGTHRPPGRAVDLVGIALAPDEAIVVRPRS